jgi:hypothetical protein
VARQRGRSTVDTTAENIGTALGRVAAKLDSWKRQRTEIAAELNRVVAAAERLLSHLGPEGAAEAAAAPNRGGRKKGYKVSAATKAKLREAWEKRRAAGNAVVQKAQKTKRKLSAAARAKISAAQKKRWAERRKT